MFAHVRRKRGECAGIDRLELRKCLQITFCSGITVLVGAQRFEGTHCLSFSPQHKISDGPPPEILYLFRESGAHTNTRTKLLVGGFKSRCDIDSVAIGSVIEKSAASEIADYCRSSMDTDRVMPRTMPFFLHRSRKNSANSSSDSAQATARAA